VGYVVKIDEFAVFRCYISVIFGNNIDIDVHHCASMHSDVHYDNNPFWISADTNKDDLECPIHLKVRLADGTLDMYRTYVVAFRAHNA